ncbi:MAG: GNAT family N-acetyltransferase [Bacteroidales bacterium]|nr:GNAT family N-acetyltransferase [Bacteroidales bacterium]
MIKLRSKRVDIIALGFADLKQFINSRPDYERDHKLIVSGEAFPDAYREEVVEMMEREPNLWRDTSPYFAFRTLWLMVDRGSKRIVGQFSFNGKPSPDADVEIFFSVEEPFRQKGYATEVMLEVLTWGGDTKLFHRVLIDADEGNKAAMASLKKLGFRKCNTSINEVTSTYYKAVYDKDTDVADMEVDGGI